MFVFLHWAVSFFDQAKDLVLGTRKEFVRISHGLGIFQIILTSMLIPDMAEPFH